MQVEFHPEDQSFKFPDEVVTHANEFYHKLKELQDIINAKFEVDINEDYNERATILMRFIFFGLMEVAMHYGIVTQQDLQVAMQQAVEAMQSQLSPVEPDALDVSKLN